MSEEDTKNPTQENGEESVSAPLPHGLELIINKRTNELIFKDPKGQSAVLKATVIEEEDEDELEDGEYEEVSPLTPEQFRDALQRLHDMGLTWTADRIPHVRATSKEKDSALLSQEFIELQEEYPELPRELSSITFHYFTGSPAAEAIVGDEETLKEKVEIARTFILNEEFRSEFFFKHAIKVPYFSDVDWEVVVKMFEKNVSKIAGVPYAILSLLFVPPDTPGQKPQNRTIAVAVDATLIQKLMGTLEEVKVALEGARHLTDLLNKRPVAEEEKNDETANSQAKEVE